jgi:hypothetical protein
LVSGPPTVNPNRSVFDGGLTDANSGASLSALFCTNMSADPWNSSSPERVSAVVTVASASPYSAEKRLVMTRSSLIASRL